jgi:hypothetical protein
MENIARKHGCFDKANALTFFIYQACAFRLVINFIDFVYLEKSGRPKVLQTALGAYRTLFRRMLDEFVMPGPLARSCGV